MEIFLEVGTMKGIMEEFWLLMGKRTGVFIQENIMGGITALIAVGEVREEMVNQISIAAQMSLFARAMIVSL